MSSKKAKTLTMTYIVTMINLLRHAFKSPCHRKQILKTFIALLKNVRLTFYVNLSNFSGSFCFRLSFLFIKSLSFTAQNNTTYRRDLTCIEYFVNISLIVFGEGEFVFNVLYLVTLEHYDNLSSTDLLKVFASEK